ncbi:TrkH family potassium uptake protein [Spiroplasma turonicum]|uniref:Potassium uptake protein KtrB n=1 Tax=Spiroplasma turonicum TaxID=216946 RepID=A0A0K1P4X9_9MOLU|nr:potassium transporter TrkG [Spiroplasma turonicum]AKU79361.1 potassium uptake protein KtrB [Spiroplasma turonicum]ALX70382.1 potassium uptake protein KtrB [Spiroplasma turonicum]
MDKNIVKDKKSIMKKDKIFKKLKNWWPFSRITGRIIIWYLLSILIGGFLLSIPGVITDENNYWKLLVGVFTASSAISDTGITMVQTNTSYSFIGQLLIIIMCQIGGIGILTLKIVLLAMLGKKVSLDDQSIAQSERGNSALSSTVEMIKDAFIFLLWLEIIGAFFLFFAFYFNEVDTSMVVDKTGVTNSYHDFGKSLWSSIFHSVSATNNAGFDIISGNSLLPYNQGNSHAYLLQVIFLCQWVIGGLGYPTYHDIKRKIKARSEGTTVKFSLFTKLNFVVYSCLFVIGPILVFITEFATTQDSQILKNGDFKVSEKLVNGEIVSTKEWVADPSGSWKPAYVWIMDLLFNVSSCRNAGFATVDINNFTAGSKVIMSLWMFIGSAPSSTAGGIRTTTFAITLLAVWSIVRNKKTVEAFKRKIPDEVVKRAFAVVIISIAIVFFVVIAVYLDSNKALSTSNDQESQNELLIKVLIYVSSAFGTVGFQPFSNDQAQNMGWISKVLLIITMFIGQLGISNTLLAFVKPKNKQNFTYVEEDVVIG